MSKTPIEITPTEITDKIVQENTRLTERANDLERIMNMVKEENVVLKKELIRIELLRAELVKETDTIELVYDADLPVDVKKVVKKRAPKKVKEMVLVDSVDGVVPPVVVKDECVCVATDVSKWAHMKKPELVDHAVNLGIKGIKKSTRTVIIEAIAKHENGGVKPIMDLIV
tara:strand:+ start:265 stop:777 length:513 start_codon:yes stop_codon:yes gene_type:complete